MMKNWTHRIALMYMKHGGYMWLRIGSGRRILAEAAFSDDVGDTPLSGD